MQPSDAQPPQKEEKVGFWAKLFGKKPKNTGPVVPPHGSQTPPPQLGNDETAPTDGPVNPPTGDSTSGVPGVGSDPAAPTDPAMPPVSDPSAPVPPATPGVPPADPGTPPVPGSDEQKPVQ